MVYMLLGTGFEETEAIAPLDLMRRANIEVLTVGINGKTVFGGHGIGITADLYLDRSRFKNIAVHFIAAVTSDKADEKQASKCKRDKSFHHFSPSFSL